MSVREREGVCRVSRRGVAGTGFERVSLARCAFILPDETSILIARRGSFGVRGVL